MQHIIEAKHPDGTVYYVGRHGLVDKVHDAFAYNSEGAATNGARYWYGTNDAFWESERRSRAAHAKKYRGWTFTPIPDTAAPR